MYSDLNDFLADLDKRKLLVRVPDAASPDLEGPLAELFRLRVAVLR